MNRRDVLAGSIGVAASVLLCGGCSLVPETMRYRVTVEVDTPQGLRTGSGVWEVATSQGPGFPGPEAASLSTRVNGEAVVVDLPAGRLFALLIGPDRSPDYPSFVVERHLRTHPNPTIALSHDWRENQRRIKKSGIAFELDADEYPAMVRFQNDKDARTIEPVDPSNLGAAFGEGVHLRRVTIQITRQRCR